MSATLRTSKSTSSLIRPGQAVTFPEITLTAEGSTSLHVNSTADVAVKVQGGIEANKLDVLQSSLFQQLATFNSNVVLNNPAFVMYFGPPQSDQTWRLRIHSGFLLFEKYDSAVQDYVSRFHLF